MNSLRVGALASSVGTWLRKTRLDGISRGELGAQGLVVLGYFAVILANADLVPLWDGLVYFDECILKAIEGGFDLMRLNCFGHPAAAHMALVAAPQKLSPGSTMLLHGTNGLLGVLALWGFMRLLRLAIAGPERAIERTLVLALMAFSPQFIAATLHLNPDFGVAVFFVLLLVALLERREPLAALAGVFLVFCKEIGSLLYLVAVLFYLVIYLTRGSDPLREKLRQLRQRSYLLLPLLLVAAYLVIKTNLYAEAIMWGAKGGDSTGAVKGLLQAFTSFSLLDPFFLNYSTLGLVVNFRWILSAAMIIFVLLRLSCWLFGGRWPVPLEGDPRLRWFCSLTFLVAFLLLTRFRTFGNARYVLPLLPLLLLCGYWALRALALRPVLLRTLLAALVPLWLLSNVQTFDPLPRAIYGTFRFGNHELLQMTSLTGECCGYGRDQLVYNLQFRHFHDALNGALALQKRVAPAAPLAIDDLSAWYILARVDAGSARRTLRLRGSRPANYLKLSELVQGKRTLPARLLYPALPNVDSARALGYLQQHYLLRKEHRIGSGGYGVSVYDFQRRAH